MEEFKGVLKSIVSQAKKNVKTIVLPESTDARVLKAASIVSKSLVANIILLGDKEEIAKICDKEKIMLDEKIKIKSIDENSKEFEEYACKLYELRKEKGMSFDEAKEILKNEIYYATMMVKLKEADGMVSGATHSTSDTLRPALQIIKSKKGVNYVSSFFLMETSKKDLGSNGLFIFSDCAIIGYPNTEQLYDITKSSIKSFRSVINDKPKVALLSYSTKESAVDPNLEKIKYVVNKIKQEEKDIEIDGELQLDAAIIKEVALSKAPNSSLKGEANILIFPDLQAGNIGYKLVERLADAIAIGPITQGLDMPVNDLSRGSSVDDIVGTIAITCLQAQNK